MPIYHKTLTFYHKDRMPMDRNISTADFIKEISEFQNNHGYRVGKICCKIWDIIKPSGISKEHLKLAGQLHDAGKLLIPPNILNAARKLTPEETAIIHQHPAGGVALLHWHRKTFPPEIADTMFLHHERWDGHGYPLGLSGKDIPLYVRIVTLADVIDALLSPRNYKKAYDSDSIYKILKKESGKIFDPYLCNICLQHLHELITAAKT